MLWGVSSIIEKTEPYAWSLRKFSCPTIFRC